MLQTKCFLMKISSLTSGKIGVSNNVCDEDGYLFNLLCSLCNLSSVFEWVGTGLGIDTVTIVVVETVVDSLDDFNWLLDSPDDSSVGKKAKSNE